MIKSNKTKGIIYIVCSAFFFAMMNLFIKLSGDLPTMQKSFFRNAIAVIFALIILTKNRDFKMPKKENIFYLFMRSLAGTIGILCNFYAVSHLNIADASMLNKLSPFFAVIFSIFILKEKANSKQALSILFAFVGSIFVMKPTFSLDALPGFIGFIGGLSAGLAYTFVRKLTLNGVKGPLVVFVFSLFSCLVTLPSLIFNYVSMTWLQLFYLLLAGLCASGGQFFITAAYSKAPAKEISIYDYSQIIFTTLISLIVFKDVPDLFSFLGYAVIIGAAIFNSVTSLKSNRV